MLATGYSLRNGMSALFYARHCVTFKIRHKLFLTQETFEIRLQGKIMPPKFEQTSDLIPRSVSHITWH